jgi:hypothetical protein
MRKFLSVRARLLWARQLATLMFVLVISIAPVGTCPALAGDDDPGTTIVQVEEDWELVVDEPDPDTLGPQATCVFSPLGNADVLYAALDLNHRSQPEFASGGLQLQVWLDDEPLATAESDNQNKLHHDNETVTWTHRIHAADGHLTFSVVNGHSESWGEFGDGELSLNFTSSVENLNQYDPQVSVANSGIGFAGNRVISLKLKKVRAFTATGDVVETSPNYVVHARD